MPMTVRTALGGVGTQVAIGLSSVAVLAAGVHGGAVTGTSQELSFSLVERTAAGVARCDSTRGSPTSSGCGEVEPLGGAPLAPGSRHTDVVLVRNTGHVSLGELSLSPGPCSSGVAGLCALLRVRIVEGSGRRVVLPDEPFSALRGRVIRLAAPTRPGQIRVVRFTVSLDRAATSRVGGASVTQPMRWSAGR